jgi:hypothetical protein
VAELRAERARDVEQWARLQLVAEALVETRDGDDAHDGAALFGATDVLEPQTQEFFPVGGHLRGDWDEQALELIRK